MSDPLEQLSDSDLHALSKNDLDSMSDEGLKIVASSGNSAEPAKEPFMHKAIRNVLPMAGTVLGGLGAGALATPETLGVGTAPAAMAGAAAGNVAGTEGASWLNHKIYGDEAPTYNSLEDLKRVGGEAAGGAVAELGGQVIGKAVGAAANSAVIKPYLDEAGQLVVNGFNKAGEYVGGKAAALAERATGAPEAAEGMGQELLDKGMVKFGDIQPKIATRLAEAPAPKGVYDPFAKKLSTRGTDFSGVADAANAAKDAAPKGSDFLDMGLIAKAASGDLKAVAGYVGKNYVLPRATSSLAATANGLSQVLAKTPQVFGKYAPALTAAAARGEMSLAASTYVLQQRDPEFRQKMQDLNNNGGVLSQDGD